MRFEKWQALGNAYLILEPAAMPWELTAARIRRLCDPHFGVGSDGVLLLRRIDDPEAVAELRIFNPDGSEAELSGNGARQAALYAHHHAWTEAETFSIRTAAGLVKPTIDSPNSATIEMGLAATISDDFPDGRPEGRGALEAGGRRWGFQHVSVGNPQCVIEVGDEIEALDVTAIGPEIENHELFPNRTNVSFTRTDGSTVRARIFERGAGETLSSGTGASGAAVAAFLRGSRSPITVQLDGGELQVEVSEQLDVRLGGPAERVCVGDLSAELLRALEES
jgi:diaminopimelate epimerase